MMGEDGLGYVEADGERIDRSRRRFALVALYLRRCGMGERRKDASSESAANSA